MAMGQQSAVPAPFSARILGPAMAGWLGRVTGLGVDTFWCWVSFIYPRHYRRRHQSLAGEYHHLCCRLPDAFGWLSFTATTCPIRFMPPSLQRIPPALCDITPDGLCFCCFAYLARESTLLVAICLIFAGWRRIRLRSALIGVIAIVCAGLVSRHYAQTGPASVHGMTGGTYILGKLVWSFFKNVLGLPLWSNTLPECTPVWVKRDTSLSSSCATRAIGVCQPSSWAHAFFSPGSGVFELVLPSRSRCGGRSFLPHRWRAAPSGDVIVLRFCIVYGLISILMTPLLGASVDRLVEYGWPFYFVVVPWFLCQSYDLQSVCAGALLMLHLCTCWLAWFAFRQQPSTYLWAGLAVLALNGVSYALIKQSPPDRVTQPLS